MRLFCALAFLAHACYAGALLGTPAAPAVFGAGLVYLAILALWKEPHP
jgi:hypothetical protein